MSSLSFKKPWDAARFRDWYSKKYSSATLPVYESPNSSRELCVVIPSDCEYSPLVLAAQFCKECHPEHLEVNTFPCAECGHQHLLKDIDLDMLEPTCRWCLKSEYGQDPLGNYRETITEMRDPHKTILVIKNEAGKEVGRVAATAPNAEAYINTMISTHGSVKIDYVEDQDAALIGNMLGRRTGL